MTLEDLIAQYHRALDEFARGDPGPVKRLFSRRNDVTLANPFGPALHGWEKLAAALDFAASRFRDGKVTAIERGATYEAGDLACIYEVERWEAKVAAREDVSPFVIRVTTVFRREAESWKIVHRHADPITTSHPEGPLRSA